MKSSMAKPGPSRPQDASKKVYVIRDPNREPDYDFWQRLCKSIGMGWLNESPKTKDERSKSGKKVSFKGDGGKTGYGGKNYKEAEKMRKRQQEKTREKRYFRFLKAKGMTWSQRSLLWINYKISRLGKTWLTYLIFLVSIILYAIVGGAIFHGIEGTDDVILDDVDNSDLRYQLRRNISYLAQLHEYKKRSDESLKETMQDHFRTFEAGVLANFQKNLTNQRGLDEKKWGFWSSVFFAFTVFTTIGYGHMAPTTWYGKVVVVIYALIGIPLFLVSLALFGKLLTRIFKFLWAIIITVYYSKTFQKSKSTVFNIDDPDYKAYKAKPDFKVDDQFKFPLQIAVMILLVYILFGSLVFLQWEKGWDFFSSFYFVFTSIATIGFGDFVPNNGKYDVEVGKMFACLLYLIIGLSLTTMCVTVLRENMIRNLVKVSAKVGQSYGVNIHLDERQMRSESAKS